jgi:TOBE domain
VIYQGDSVLMIAEIAGRRVSIRRPARGGIAASLPAPGERLILGLAASDTIVVPAGEGGEANG